MKMILYGNFEDNCFLLVIFILKWRLLAYFQENQNIQTRFLLAQINVYLFKKLKYLDFITSK